ncbi:MAG: hypothetical protein PHX27_03860 [Candidatus ainarchaeum sp.]|nr:hypothetical protein [Candidatus ainarchaeum sp.]
MVNLEIDGDLDSNPKFKINKKIVLLILIIFVSVVVGGIFLTNLNLINQDTFVYDYNGNSQEVPTFFPDDFDLNQSNSDYNIPTKEEYESQLPVQTSFCEFARTINLESGIFALPSDALDSNSNISNYDHHAKYFLIYNNGVFVKALENYDAPTEKRAVELLLDNGVENIITRRDYATGLNEEAKNNGINCYWASWPRLSMEKLISKEPV